MENRVSIGVQSTGVDEADLDDDASPLRLFSGWGFILKMKLIQDENKH